MGEELNKAKEVLKEKYFNLCHKRRKFGTYRTAPIPYCPAFPTHFETHTKETYYFQIDMIA